LRFISFIDFVFISPCCHFEEAQARENSNYATLSTFYSSFTPFNTRNREKAMSDGGDFDGGGGFGGDFGGDGDFGGGEGQYTETEYTSWGDRLKGSCAGICIGLILFFGSFPLIFWNEERAVQRYDALQEGESQTISVSGMGLDVSNEGKLLHFTADIVNAGDKIVDPIFGIETDGLKLRRKADMYQVSFVFLIKFVV
jgi:hypothetical protein